VLAVLKIGPILLRQCAELDELHALTVLARWAKLYGG
jgi:hypothetical protein